MERGDGVEFRKSTFCNVHDCVEIAFVNNGARLIRDSKHRGGPALRFTESEWDAFVKGIKAGEFG